MPPYPVRSFTCLFLAFTNAFLCLVIFFLTCPSREDGQKRIAGNDAAPVVNGIAPVTIDPGLKELDGKLTSILKVGSRYPEEDDDADKEEGGGGGRERELGGGQLDKEEGKENDGEEEEEEGMAKEQGEGEEREEDVQGNEGRESPDKPHQNNRS